MLSIFAGILHAAATPFADIVLLSFNSATAIVIQVFIATCFLNEVIICRYDLPALFLIIIGSVFIILTANFDEVPSSVASHKEDLTSIKTILYGCLVFVLLNITFFTVKSLRRYLALFEQNAEEWLKEAKNDMKVDSSVNLLHELL